MNRQKIVNMFMQRSTLKAILLLLIVAFCTAGCNASKKSNCGCPNKKNMVGY
jgi:uncharacterized lipoprotein YajG